MAKAKTTEVHYEISGYHKHYYVDTPVVRVVVSGTYEGHNLKGVCLVNDGSSHWRDTVELTGDGRYSFMIGGRSLHHSDQGANIIKKAAEAAAKDWQASNPNALHEFHVSQAIKALERCNTREVELTIALANAVEERKKAEQSFAALGGDAS